MSDLTITFDSPADVWRVQRGLERVEISLEEMTDEYCRWHRAGAQGEWREHAEAFCRKKLEEATVER